MKPILLAAILLCAAPALAPSGNDDFHQRAAELKQGEKWAELQELAQARVEQVEDELERAVARAYLAIACAGKREFTECVAALRAIEESGQSAKGNLGSAGAPLVEAVNAIYMHCWANWDPEFNRKAWGELFDAFPDGNHALVPASRLLMAALKLDDRGEIERLEAWFDDLASQAQGNLVWERDALKRCSQAYVRAGVGGERTIEMARKAFELAWEMGARAGGYEEPEPGAEPDLERRERCDLESDHEYNHLVLACWLSGVLDGEENPLIEREPEPGAVFEDATEEVGLAGLRRSRVAVGDFDDDGDPDLCFQGQLFRNEKGKRFEDVSEELGVAARGASALFFDYDDDGDLDLLLPAAPHPRLLRNGGKRGRFRFEDVTAAAGLDALKVESTPEGAACFDMDGDGRLDFYLAAYENPMSQGHPDLLARNRGNGTFEDVSQASGVLAVSAMCGRGVAAADYDEDGDQDVHVSNYRLNRNFLFQNDGEGGFEDAAPGLELEGVCQPEDSAYFGHTIGSAWGDVDGDADLDLFCANLAHPRFVFQGFSNLSMLYLSSGAEGGYGFSEERRARGIRFQETHSDPALVDYDNDGDLDLSITCIYEGVPSALYQNDGSGHYAPVTFSTGVAVFNGWGQAWLDFDGDGDLDLVVASGSGVRFLRNLGNDNHWLRLRIQGSGKNRFGVGAMVRVETVEEQPRVLLRHLAAGRGTTSQDEGVVHFGLGDFSGKVRVTADWPGRRKPIEKVFRTDRVGILR